MIWQAGLQWPNRKLNFFFSKICVSQLGMWEPGQKDNIIKRVFYFFEKHIILYLFFQNVIKQVEGVEKKNKIVLN